MEISAAVNIWESNKEGSIAALDPHDSVHWYWLWDKASVFGEREKDARVDMPQNHTTNSLIALQQETGTKIWSNRPNLEVCPDPTAMGKLSYTLAQLDYWLPGDRSKCLLLTVESYGGQEALFWRSSICDSPLGGRYENAGPFLKLRIKERRQVRYV